eukprot:scaffold3878_cov363-Prasinococcus_capsulatus_cf.AAC.3
MLPSLWDCGTGADKYTRLMANRFESANRHKLVGTFLQTLKSTTWARHPSGSVMPSVPCRERKHTTLYWYFSSRYP